MAEALLMAADRAQHVAEVVRPALLRGAWVVSDRFVPSSLAYQGVGRGPRCRRDRAAQPLATGGLEPDLVVVLDVSHASVRAAAGRRERDRIEGEDDAFTLAVHEAYRDLAEVRGWDVVDGGGTLDEVADAVWSVVRDRCSL